jgi:hypothetical protein
MSEESGHLVEKLYEHELSQNKSLIVTMRIITEERDRMKKALEFYASKDNWFSGGCEGDGNGYDGDMGDKAREALK